MRETPSSDPWAPHDARRPRRTRVVVTGLGAICAAGAGVPALRAALHAEETCIRPLTLFDTTGLKTHIAGEVAALPSCGLLPRAGRVRASRSDRFAMIALEEALRSSGLTLPLADPKRVGVAIGSSTGGMLETEHYYRRKLEGT